MEYRCDKCNRFCTDEGYYEIKYFNEKIKIAGSMYILAGRLCSECAQGAIDVMKNYVSGGED